MADATYVQSNFLGGEVSPAFQGRVEDQEYKNSLALCLNYIPGQEGSLIGRSGFKRIGNTRDNSPARLLPFRFSAFAPYVSEFTANNLRFWANGLPILAPETAGIVSVTGTPPVFTILDTRSSDPGLVPPEWSDGDRLLTIFGNAGNLAGAPHMANREWILTIVDRAAGEITLTDAETGVPLATAPGPFGSGIGAIGFYRIIDLETPYEFPEGVRQVQYTSQRVKNVDGTNSVSASVPDHRVTYLYPLCTPHSLSSGIGLERGLIQERFIDGPYLDSTGTDIPVTVSATTGSIELTLHGWSADIYYQAGDLVVSYATGDPYYYLALQAGKGNALQESSPFINANWLMVRVNENYWSSGDTYDIGFHTVAAPFNADGVGTIYYSKITANTNHTPATSPVQWSTTPPTWGALVTYAKGAFVVQSGTRYLAFGTPVVGTDPASDPTHWMVAPDLASAVDEFSNTATGWLSAPLFYMDDAGSDVFGLALGNPGRLIRLKWGPQPWNSKTSYALNDLVNFEDVIYKSLAGSNLNHSPDTDATNWEIQSDTIRWTWGEITDASTHMLQATITLLGDDLPDDSPIWEFRMGVYSDTTGWPTCAGYHEGRLWLSGVGKNRIDGGVSNQGFNFAPTAPDGTVSDANAIAVTMNCEQTEQIQGLASATEGLLVLTSEREWLLSASALNDPLTPTSAQVRPTTAWSAHPNETTRLPSAVAAIQNGGRRVLEYRTFADMGSYQSRLNVVDMTRRCQHLTVGGVGVTQYQCLSQPVLWCCPSDYLIADWTNSLAHSVCPLPITPPVIQPSTETVLTSCTLFGIGYARSPDITYNAPFSFEHGRTLAGDTQTISSIAVQKGILATSEYLYAVVTGSDGLAHVEMLMPNFESTPLYDTYNGDDTVDKFGTLSQSFMLDSGVRPAGCVIAADGLSADFYGLGALAGEEVQFTIRGKYVGDYTIDSNGHVNVPFSTGTDTTFLISDIGRAMCADLNSNLLPGGALTYGGQIFLLDPNGNTGIDAPEDATESVNFFGQFGFKYRRRGKMLRPQVGGQNGPTFAKTVRNDQMGIYVDAAQEISAGGSFSTLVPCKLTKDGTRDVRAVGRDEFVTGIFRVYVKDAYNFDGQLCWEQTRPVPGNVIAVGGFDVVMDK